MVFVVAFAICQNSLAATQGAWFSELFNTNTRSSGASPGLPAVRGRLRLHRLLGGLPVPGFGWIGPAVLFCSYGAVGLIAALATPETNGPARRAQVAELTARRSRVAARSP